MAQLKVREEKTNEAAENENMAKATSVETIEQTAKAEKKPVKVITADEEEEKLDNVITLSQPYNYEGEVIETLDLTKIEDLNAIQMQKADNIYRKLTKNVSTTPELTYDYAIAVAHVLTGYPLEFFRKISAKDLTKIKTRVINFLYSED